MSTASALTKAKGTDVKTFKQCTVFWSLLHLFGSVIPELVGIDVIVFAYYLWNKAMFGDAYLHNPPVISDK